MIAVMFFMKDSLKKNFNDNYTGWPLVPPHNPQFLSGMLEGNFPALKLNPSQKASQRSEKKAYGTGQATTKFFNHFARFKPILQRGQ